MKKYVKSIKKIFKILQEANIGLGPDKCEFHTKEVKFLRSVIMTNRIWMDKEKVNTIRKWPEQKNFKKVQAFLRFANFYQIFFQRYSQICTPLLISYCKPVA